MSAENETARAYFMRDDMKKYMVDLDIFFGNKEKVAAVSAKIEKLMEAENMTCEEAMMVPAFLYMRMEMNAREQLNTRRYSANITSGT